MKCSDKDQFEIVYLDNHLLVVKKKAGLLTQSSKESNEASLEALLKKELKEKLRKKGDVFLHPLHRIDKSVSGLVLFAKTSKALSRLNEEIREKKVERRYFALVEGILEKKEAILEHFLLREEYRSRALEGEISNSKRAILEYRVIKEENNLSLIEVNLITGRYHQIRAQFSAISHPILGDKKYGSKKDLKEIALHGYFLKFSHPVTKKSLSFEWKKDFDFYL